MSEKQPIEKNLTPGASNLFIIFGGIGAGIMMPPFEFYRTAQIIDENKIFIRDLRQCWYHDGLPGISNGIYSTAAYIEQEIQAINPDEVYFVGNSMGGYAAILFAALIGRGEVIAFAPQTFISPYLRLRHRDRRWQRQILNVYRQSLAKEKVWDLKYLIAKMGSNQKISIFISNNHRLDLAHAQHLESFSTVSIFEFAVGGHGVVKYLRDMNQLPAILLGNYP